MAPTSAYASTRYRPSRLRTTGPCSLCCRLCDQVVVSLRRRAVPSSSATGDKPVSWAEPFRRAIVALAASHLLEGAMPMNTASMASRFQHILFPKGDRPLCCRNAYDQESLMKPTSKDTSIKTRGTTPSNDAPRRPIPAQTARDTTWDAYPLLPADARITTDPSEVMLDGVVLALNARDADRFRQLIPSLAGRAPWPGCRCPTTPPSSAACLTKASSTTCRYPATPSTPASSATICTRGSEDGARRRPRTSGRGAR
jgi:hypothetical protein